MHFESPAGQQHIAAEGYVVCDGQRGTHGFDAGIAEAGFTAPIIRQPNGPNTLPLTMTRTTRSGVFQLRQTFTRDILKKAVLITMTLTNISSADRGFVSLERYFHGQIDGTGPTRYARTARSVWGWTQPEESPSPGEGRGLMLTALTPTIDGVASIETFTDWDPNRVVGGAQQTARGCGAFQPQPGPTVPGDFIGRIGHQVWPSLPAGSSKTVRVLYQRF
jgi:hypothetical protein